MPGKPAWQVLSATTFASVLRTGQHPVDTGPRVVPDTISRDVLAGHQLLNKGRRLFSGVLTSSASEAGCVGPLLAPGVTVPLGPLLRSYCVHSPSAVASVAFLIRPKDLPSGPHLGQSTDVLARSPPDSAYPQFSIPLVSKSCRWSPTRPASFPTHWLSLGDPCLASLPGSPPALLSALIHSLTWLWLSCFDRRCSPFLSAVPSSSPPFTQTLELSLKKAVLILN